MTDKNELDEELTNDGFEGIATRIKHVLEIYPILSPTMLQAALGPQVPAKEWRPVLEDMIENKIVVQETQTKLSPANRYNDYQRIMLTGTSEQLKAIAN